MAGEALLYTPFVAAAAMFALAGWLLVLNFRSSVNRAFALFLVLVGMTRLINGIRFLALAADPAGFAVALYAHYDLDALRDYYVLATPFALAYFFVAYSRPGGVRAWAWTGRGILAMALAVEVAYALDHGLHSTTLPDGRLDLGPLAVLSYGVPLGYALVALSMAWEASKDLMAPRRAAAFLVATGLALNAFFESGIQVAFVLLRGIGTARAAFAPSLVLDLTLAAYILAFGASLAALGVHLRGAARRPAARRKVAIVAALHPLAALCAIYLVFAGTAVDDLHSVAAVTLGTVWRILLPALVAYALVRHRLFSIDAKIQWTISRGAITVVFLAIFFATSKVVENLLNERFGLLFGGISAGILLFAISPLERFGQRIAHAVMPNAGRPGALAHRERLRLFEEQARLVWSDGSMGRRERRILDNLRERLGLGFEEASRIEHAAALGRPSAKH